MWFTFLLLLLHNWPLLVSCCCLLLSKNLPTFYLLLLRSDGIQRSTQNGKKDIWHLEGMMQKKKNDSQSAVILCEKPLPFMVLCFKYTSIYHSLKCNSLPKKASLAIFYVWSWVMSLEYLHRLKEDLETVWQQKFKNV